MDLVSIVSMPSGVAPLAILSPENAALAAAKMPGLPDPVLQSKIEAYQNAKREDIEMADQYIQG